MNNPFKELAKIVHDSAGKIWSKEEHKKANQTAQAEAEEWRKTNLWKKCKEEEKELIKKNPLIANYNIKTSDPNEWINAKYLRWERLLLLNKLKIRKNELNEPFKLGGAL